MDSQDAHVNIVKKESFLRKLKKNFLYIFMLIAVVTSLILEIYNKNLKEENGIEVTVNEKTNFLPKYTIGLIVASIIGFIAIMAKNSKDYQEQSRREQKDFVRYVEPVPREEYQKITEEVTKKELDKLYQSPDFKKMLAEKGRDQKNWAWQSREKEGKAAWREEESDDSIDLSKSNADDE
jgi:hypothetical protein